MESIYLTRGVSENMVNFINAKSNIDWDFNYAKMSVWETDFVSLSWNIFTYIILLIHEFYHDCIIFVMGIPILE